MLVDNIFHYILYGVILIATFIILKSPKKKDDEDKNKKD
jgi:hypothetical protein